jgi:hypothetical protein
MIDTDADELDFYIDYDPLASGEVVAHIHGPALHTVPNTFVFLLPAGSPKIGTWNYDPFYEADLLAGRMYVNIHSNDFPAGEIRGQITSIVSPMDETQEVGKASAAAGCTLCSIDKTNDDLGFHVVFDPDALEGTETVAHIHGFAPAGQTAPPLLTLALGSPKLGIWDFLNTEQDDVQDGLTYVNIHTNVHPTGEIRGQLLFPAKACTLQACGDADDNGIRDDACLWYDCVAEQCSSVARTTQADMGGFSGACPIDLTCDGNDRFHALNCFSNLSTTGAIGYPCEPSPPFAVNVDGGSPSSCALDGTCDGNDAFHALNCFENDWFDGSIGYQCTCPGAPAALLPPPVAATEHTGLILKGPAVAAPGEIVEVEVYLQDALTALRGYQLHLQARTGKAGVLQLLDIGVDRARPDYAFATVPGAWSAFNRDVAQMVVGMDAPEGRPVPAGAYLATFTYRIPKDAAGTFAIEVLHDPAGESREQRTFLFGESARLIAIGPLTAATITVSGSEPPTRSRNP